MIFNTLLLLLLLKKEVGNGLGFWVEAHF